MDGFVEEKGKPSRTNLLMFKEYLMSLVLDEDQPQDESWDEVLSSVYHKLAFFRNYYCGVMPSNDVATGGMRELSKEVDRNQQEITRRRYQECFDKEVLKSAMQQQPTSAEH